MQGNSLKSLLAGPGWQLYRLLIWFHFSVKVVPQPFDTVLCFASIISMARSVIGFVVLIKLFITRIP